MKLLRQLPLPLLDPRPAPVTGCALLALPSTFHIECIALLVHFRVLAWGQWVVSEVPGSEDLAACVPAVCAGVAVDLDVDLVALVASVALVDSADLDFNGQDNEREIGSVESAISTTLHPVRCAVAAKILAKMQQGL